MQPPQSSPTERHDARVRAKAIYDAVKDTFPPHTKGKIVAIEIDSGEYFVGATILEASRIARTKYPDKMLHFFRLGFPAVYVWR